MENINAKDDTVTYCNYSTVSNSIFLSYRYGKQENDWRELYNCISNSEDTKTISRFNYNHNETMGFTDKQGVTTLITNISSVILNNPFLTKKSGKNEYEFKPEKLDKLIPKGRVIEQLFVAGEKEDLPVDVNIAIEYIVAHLHFNQSVPEEFRVVFIGE